MITIVLASTLASVGTAGVPGAGIYRNADIYLNQNYVGKYVSGYTHFFYDITDFLRENEENTIAIRVDAMGREGWWYEGGGIYKHVWLHICDDILIELYDLHIEAEVSDDLTCGNLSVTAEVVSRRIEATSAELLSIVFDREGREAARLRKEFTLSPWDKVKVQMATTLSGADFHLWELDDTNLYKVKTYILYDNHTEKELLFSNQSDSFGDDYAEYFGFRKIEFTPDKGFWLNGKRTLIKGLCTHHDHAGVGIGVPDSVLEYRLREMKKCGMNALRSVHGEPSDIVLCLCDRLGILVLSETRQMGSSRDDIEAMRAVVKQGRNHPSVILWGIGNEEVNVQMKKETAKTVISMRQEIRLLDNTRPVTYALGSYADIGIWDQETAYRDLKYPLCLKAFHSKKYNYIVQEVYARAIMFNYCSEIATHAEIPDKERKLQYQVNFAQAIKICRDHLRNRDERCLINASGLIVNNIEPIRPDRTYRRQARFKLPICYDCLLK